MAAVNVAAVNVATVLINIITHSCNIKGSIKTSMKPLKKYKN